VRWTALDISSERLCGWNETLASFNLRLTHLPGKENIVADALSRQIEDKILDTPPLRRKPLTAEHNHVM
jgi:hypothetical protein